MTYLKNRRGKIGSWSLKIEMADIIGKSYTIISYNFERT